MRARLLMVLALGAGACAGCAAILGIDDGTPRGDGGEADASVDVAAFDAAANDGDAADVVVVPTCKPTTKFTSIKAITELATTGAEQHPRLVPDETKIFFQRVPSSFVVFTATRPDRFSAFGPATAVNELVSDAGNAADPTIDPSGLRIVIASSRAGGGGGSYDLWTATRPTLGSPFTTPTALPALNSGGYDHYGSFASASALYFSSDRTGVEDIYRSAVTGSTFGAPVLVTGLSTSAYEAAPTISPDELVAYVAGIVPDDAGGTQAIFASSRASAASPWPAPAVVPELLNGSSIPGWLSPDLCRLYFSSSRGGNFDLYVAERIP